MTSENRDVGAGVAVRMFLASFLALTGDVLSLSSKRLRVPGGGEFLGKEDFCLAFLPMENIASGRCVVVWTGDVQSMLPRRTEKNV